MSPKTSQRILASLRTWGASTARVLADRLGMKREAVGSCLWMLHIQGRAEKTSDPSDKRVNVWRVADADA